jgi:Uma2 family endonuclease
MVVKWTGLGQVFAGVGISDRREGWEKNFRVPDVSVFLNGNTAENCGTHWCGGPDFAAEIVSPRDRTRKKIPFYEKIGTRELLIVDRRPWRISLFRLTDGKLIEVGQSTVTNGEVVASEAVPLSFQLIQASDRPTILVNHRTEDRQWTIEARPENK